VGGLAVFGSYAAVAAGVAAVAAGDAAAATAATVASAGTVLSRTASQLSQHAIDRLGGREADVTMKMIEVALEKGQRYWDPVNRTVQHVLEG